MTRPAPTPDALARARAAMVEVVAEEVLWTNRFLGKTALDPGVIEAMGAVPREEFVPAELAEFAYDNRPLPIGQGQTISQPYIVAVMTDLLGPRPGHRVLEVGTGCGYQAAVLARLVAQVYSVETVPELAEQAAERLKRLGIANVLVRQGDGNKGWPEHAPYDGVIVTAAAPGVPPALVQQLGPGGRLVIPLGPRGGEQDLVVIRKEADGALDRRVVLPVAFVPLVKG
ncbi:MAG: protein-L-isoaspartate(D-aspartate) O-methyltransferase [Rhodospirillales bacterium]